MRKSPRKRLLALNEESVRMFILPVHKKRKMESTLNAYHPRDGSINCSTCLRGNVIQQCEKGWTGPSWVAVDTSHRAKTVGCM